MPAGPEDDLDRLVDEVRKVIHDNHEFLKMLAKDTSGLDGIADDEEEERCDDEYMEL